MIVGVAGHIDHGKTALVRALTGVAGDRLKEEKARGVTIDLGFAYLPVGDHIIGFIDAPGHEKLVHTMLAGASGVDFALLTVAADDGIMPQTREHLAVLDLLGVSRGLVALTKCDLVDAARLEALKGEIAAALAGGSLSGAQILLVSSLTGEGIDALRDALAEAAAQPSPHAATGAFRLAVDRSFTLAGVGVVVTGTILSGRVGVGDRVVVSPAGIEARVRSLHAQNRPAQSAAAGERCALNLAGPDVAKEAISRGDVALDPALHAPTSRVDATLRLLPGEEKPIGAWHAARLHHGAAETGVHIAPLEEGPIRPGESACVQLVLDAPIAAAAGDRYVLRDASARRTIGGGVFLDLRPASRKRRSPQRAAQRAALALADPAAAFAALLAAPPFAHDLAAFARDRALSEAEAERIVADAGLVTLPDRDARFCAAPAFWREFSGALKARLAQFHTENPDMQGLGAERLRLTQEPRLPAAAFRAALRRLAGAGEIALAGAFAQLPGHQPRLAPRDEAAWSRFAALLGGAERFRPPRVRDLGAATGAAEEDVRRVLKLAARMGLVDEIAHDHFFLRQTTHEMARVVTDLDAGGLFTAAQLRDRLDNGRKVAIQILEFFDRHGLTVRRGDLRRLDRRRLDLFAPLERPVEKGQDS
ncbi:selenocysteine-specific translation elongation factor [Methylocella sp.]|uniref:selenocysteine-specific translation elongation factor n=1 Tax=Methylocella sp. TaxID=1978226 RepID=UPI0037833343